MERQNAIVTGSTQGIGLAIAHALAESGRNILLNGFGDPDEIEKTRREMAERHGVTVRHSGADLSRPEQIEEMVAEAREAFGSVNILVNNAGIQHVAPIEEFPPEKWDAILAVNLSGAFHAIRTVLPGMRERGWGRIVNIASAHGLVASPYKSAYVAAKHGILGLTKVVALEAAEDGVTVNALCPGYVKTPLVEGQIADQAESRGISEEAVVRDVILAAQPTKEFVKAEEIAAMTVYLSGDSASSITGTSISLDGGWTAH